MEAVLGHTSAPGVSGLALFRLMPEFKRNTLQTFVNLADRYGEIVCFRGLWTSFMLTDAQHVEYVLQTNSRNYRKGKNYKEVAAATVCLSAKAMFGSGSDDLHNPLSTVRKLRRSPRL